MVQNPTFQQKAQEQGATADYQTPAQLGDKVKAGQLIAEIDSVPQQNTLRNAEAALANMEAQLKAQKATQIQTSLALQRQKELRAADANARADLESAQAANDLALANIDALKAQILQAQVTVDTAKVNMGYTRITAPIDGQVVAIVTQQGQTVNANQSTPTIIKLAQTETMTVKTQISDADVTRVTMGQKVYFTILGEPNKRYTATLRAGLFSFALPLQLPEISISLLWHPRLHADPAHRWLRECVRSICATGA